MLRITNLFASAALLSVALARTDLSGCTSTDVSSPAGASVAWYVPGTGELCDFLDCGGGRAPPKTNVPGCPLYSGTATYSPSYLPGFGAAAAATSMASAAASTSAGPITTPAALSLGTTITLSSAPEAATSSEPESSSSSFDAITSSTELSTAAPATSTVEPASIASATSTVEPDSIASPAVTSSSPISVQSVVSTTTQQSSSVASAGFTTSLGRNATQPTPSLPASASFTGAAAQLSRVWYGSAGLVALGALVAAL